MRVPSFSSRTQGSRDEIEAIPMPRGVLDAFSHEGVAELSSSTVRRRLRTAIFALAGLFLMAGPLAAPAIAEPAACPPEGCGPIDPPEPQPPSYLHGAYRHYDIYGSGRVAGGGTLYYIDYLGAGIPQVRRVPIEMFSQVDFSNLDFRKERVNNNPSTYRLRSWATGKCLDADNAGGQVHGRQVWLATCNDHVSQRWRDGEPYVENNWQYRQFLSVQNGFALHMNSDYGVLASPNWNDNDQWFGAASHS
jgi:hypothetical protein